MARKEVFAFALAAFVVACCHHHSRCHAAVIGGGADAADHDASANTATSDQATASNSTAKQPVCPPLDLLIVNPIDIAFSRDCVLTYLARAFSKDLAPINKKAITYAVNRLERALTAIQMLNQQMQACDGAVRAATNPRAIMDPGMLPPGMMMVPRGVPVPPPPPPSGPEDGSSGSDDASAPSNDGPANALPTPTAPTAAVIGQTVVLPPGSAVVVPTQAVSAAAAKQAVLSNNGKTTPK